MNEYQNDAGPEERSLSGEVTSLSASMQTSGISVTSRAMDVDVVTSIPFAMVDEITESSPAAEDGLQLGDQVVKFGNVEGGDNLLQRLSAEAQASQGQAVSVGVIRQGAKLDLAVTPRVWQGRGLLGYVHTDTAVYIQFLFTTGGRESRFSVSTDELLTLSRLIRFHCRCHFRLL